MTFETFDQIDEKTWPDPKKDNDKDKYKDKDKNNDKDKDISESTLTERSQRLVFFETFDQSDEDTWPDQKKETMTKTNTKTMIKTKTFKEHIQRAILVTCDIWDTDYISDNWEPEFVTIVVTWQLRVTLDSIRNSCDVCSPDESLR